MLMHAENLSCWTILGWIFASFNLNVLRYPPYTVLHQCSQACYNLCFKGFQDFVKSNDDYILHHTCIILCIDVWRYFSIYRNWNTNYIFNLHPLILWIIRHMRIRQELHGPIWWFHDPFCSHLIYQSYINLMSFSVYIWPETVKLGFDLCDLDLWPTLTLTFCTDLSLVIGNNSWKFHDDTMRVT